MDLLERYINEVGKHLPAKTRADIQVEIRSTLQDMIEDRSQEAGRPVDDELTSQVLREYGAPAKVAAAYKPRQYLVGPRLFPIFELVLKIVLVVLLAVSLVGLGVTVFTTSMTGWDLAMALFRAAGQLLAGSIAAFGNIVLIFAILERTLPASEFEEKPEAWDPSELTEEPDPDDVKRGELIFDVVFTIIGLVIFNLYPQLIGIPFVVNGHWAFVPILSEAFFAYLPWIDLLWLSTLVLDVVLIHAETWTLPARIFRIALSLAEIILAVVMLRGPALVTIAPETLAVVPLGDAAGTLATMLNFLPLLVLGILIIVNTVEIFQQIRRLLARQPAPALPEVK
jgi:hypothetical protein